jgi:hypothetical protein
MIAVIDKNLNRDDWIRTSGPFVPNEVRYQAALHPVNRNPNPGYHIPIAAGSSWVELKATGFKGVALVNITRLQSPFKPPHPLG